MVRFRDGGPRAILDHIAVDRPRSAAMLDERIETRVEALADFPNSGRPGRVAGTRELVLVGTSYVVAYRIEASVVRILRVLHMSRLWPDDLS